jgi:rhodanese-related sulfurtransferase
VKKRPEELFICSALIMLMRTVITPDELKKDIESGKPMTILDVREAWEYEAGHIKDAVNISVRSLGSSTLKQIPKEKPVVTVCEHGVRAEFARKVLEKLGYRVVALAGGMAAWRAEE